MKGYLGLIDFPQYVEESKKNKMHMILNLPLV